MIYRSESIVSENGGSCEIEVSADTAGQSRAVVNLISKSGSGIALQTKAYLSIDGGTAFRPYLGCKNFCSDFRLDPSREGDFFYLERGNDGYWELFRGSYNEDKPVSLGLKSSNLQIHHLDDENLCVRAEGKRKYNGSVFMLGHAALSPRRLPPGDILYHLCSRDASSGIPNLKRSGIRKFVVMRPCSNEDDISSVLSGIHFSAPPPQGTSSNAIPHPAEAKPAISSSNIRPPSTGSVRTSSLSSDIISANNGNDLYLFDGYTVKKSDDHGKTWHPVYSNNGVLSAFLLDRTMRSRFFYFVYNGVLVILDTESGDRIVNLPNDIDYDDPGISISTNFHDHKTMILNVGNAGCSRFGSDSDKCMHQIYLSTNAGSSWRYLDVPYARCFFVSSSSLFNINKNMILCESEIIGDTHVRLYLITDYRSMNIKSTYDSVDKYLFDSDLLLLSRVTRDGHLYSYTFDGENHSDIPLKDLTNGTTIEINVLGFGNDVKFLYATTLDGNTYPYVTIFSLSKDRDPLRIISGVHVNESYSDSSPGLHDSHFMKGVPGTLLANVVEDYATIKPYRGDKRVKTHITHNLKDFGYLKNYKLLDAPSNKTPSADTSLHLSFSYSLEGPRTTYLVADGNGIMVANGNVGKYLDTDSMSLFLTIDGGRTWEQIYQLPCTCSLADYGNIIACIPISRKTETLVYSVNGGQTFSTVNITELESYDERFVAIKPTKFLKVGKGDTSSIAVAGNVFYDYNSAHGVVTFSFSSTYGKECGSPGTAGNYEKWSPLGSSENSGGCVLGKKISYFRRKPGSMCMVGLGKDMISSEVNCECTTDDFECSVGNKRDSEGLCVPQSERYSSSVTCRPDGKLEYSGYSLSRFTACTGGLSSYKALGGPCDAMAAHRNISYGNTLLILVTLGIILGIPLSLYNLGALSEKIRRVSEYEGLRLRSGSHSILPSLMYILNRIKYSARVYFYGICWKFVMISSAIRRAIERRSYSKYFDLGPQEYKYVDIARDDDYEGMLRFVSTDNYEPLSSDSSQED